MGSGLKMDSRVGRWAMPLLVAMLCSCVGGLPLGQTKATEHTASELFSTLIRGMGGAGALDKLEALRTVSTTAVRDDEGDWVVKADAMWVLPNRYHVDYVSPGRKLTSVITGDDAFRRLSGRITQMDDGFREQTLRAMRMNPILIARRRNDPSQKLEHLGSDAVTGVQVEVLKVTFGSDETRLFIDPVTGHILKTLQRALLRGREADLEALSSDFRLVGEFTFPFKQTRNFDGKLLEAVVVSEVTVNPKVDPKIFSRK